MGQSETSDDRWFALERKEGCALWFEGSGVVMGGQAVIDGEKREIRVRPGFFMAGPVAVGKGWKLIVEASDREVSDAPGPTVGTDEDRTPSRGRSGAS